MAAVRKYPEELRQRAIRLVRDADAEPGTSRKQACRRVGQQLGISAETLRGWVNRAEIDDGDKPGITTETTARIAELETLVKTCQADSDYWRGRFWEEREAHATTREEKRQLSVELAQAREHTERTTIEAPER